jgi:energy-coupling factor transporter ATP-binding protein EcfA2
MPGDGRGGLPVLHGRLEVRALYVRDRGGFALRSVGFELAGGRMAVVGPNGAGKSSLVRCIAGVVPAYAGTVRWTGRDITRWSPAGRVSAGISLVPEGRQIFHPPTSAALHQLCPGLSTAPAVPGKIAGPGLSTAPTLTGKIRVGTLDGLLHGPALIRALPGGPQTPRIWYRGVFRCGR